MDQLSITAWLPAVVLVGNGAVLLVLSAQDKLDFAEAIATLTAMEWGAIIVGLFAVTIAAVSLQAFEFEILRFFEGYHRSRKMARHAARRIEKHVVRRQNIENRVRESHLAAFTAARISALGEPYLSVEDRAAWDVLERVIRGWDVTDEDRLHLDRASALNWPHYSSAPLLHRWDIAQLQLSEYPERCRVLPTRLGNAMRAAEDEVFLEEGEDLEGFMIRNYDHLPETVTEEHDAYRGRLEMYLSLVVTSILLAAASAVCLSGWTGSTPTDYFRIVIPLLYLLTGVLCYRAAVASALGFGVALREASSWVRAHDPGATSESA